MVPMNGYNRGDFYCFSYWFTIFDGLKTSDNFVDYASTNNPVNSYNPGDIAIISAGAAEGKVGVAPVNRYNLADFQLLYCLIRGIPFATAFPTRPQPDRTTMTQQMFNDQLAAELEPVMTQQMFNDQLAAALAPKQWYLLESITISDAITSVIARDQNSAGQPLKLSGIMIYMTSPQGSDDDSVDIMTKLNTYNVRGISGIAAIKASTAINSFFAIARETGIWHTSAGASTTTIVSAVDNIGTPYSTLNLYNYFNNYSFYTHDHPFVTGTVINIYGRDA